MEPHEELANAIIKQAAVDYRKALSTLQKSPKYNAALETKSECERFFRSSWFACLTTLDGETLINMIAKEIK